MKKIVILFFVFSLGLCADELEMFTSHPPIVCSSIQGVKWVEQCIEQHPEILWLADAQVRKTEEGQATVQGSSYSEQLFGKKYVEFDRTIMTLHCLKLLLDGSDKAYEEFTSAQPANCKLTRESFQTLHSQGRQLLESKWQGLSAQQLAQAMETALVLGDMGKSQKAREIFKPYGIQAPDQDDFYGEAMGVLEKVPSLSPTFASLPPSAKKLLIDIANLAHYGHITHLEGGIDMFSKLKKSGIVERDPVALAFDLFVHTCDVAGALGHVNHHSSLAYTELTHRALQATGEAVKVLSDPKKSEWDAFNAYVKVRASWLGLDPENSSDRVLVRVGAMLRLFTPEEGAILKTAMSQIDASMRNKIAEQLNAEQTRTPTYMPALLVNLSNNLELGKTQEDRLNKAVTIGLPFIARVLERHKEMLLKKEIDPNIPLNFNKMAGYAKSDPALLNNQFYIDKEGNIRPF